MVLVKSVGSKRTNERLIQFALGFGGVCCMASITATLMLIRYVPYLSSIRISKSTYETLTNQPM